MQYVFKKLDLDYKDYVIQNEKYMIIPDNYKNEDGCDWYGLREKLDKASQDYYKSSEEITSIKKFQ